MNVSVIIPALNESANIAGAIQSAKSGGPGVEVIVADGGSSDNTVEKAQSLGAKVVKTAPGRGRQMDAGAAASRGTVLLFLHADTRLPERWLEAINGALNEEGAVGGGFRISIDSLKFSYRLVEWIINLRARLFKLIYGDQALFFKKDAFIKAGGYRNLPLMEDIDCVKRLGGLGRIVLLKEKALTSPRRWEEGGIVRTSLRNWRLLLLYRLGTAAADLYERYYGTAGKRG